MAQRDVVIQISGGGGTGDTEPISGSILEKRRRCVVDDLVHFDIAVGVSDGVGDYARDT